MSDDGCQETNWGLFSGVWRGGVAQLGERLLCKQEVVGSIPITSTRLLGTKSLGTRARAVLGFVVSREVSGLAARVRRLCFFVIVDRVNLDLADIVRGFAPGGFGGVQVLMNVV